MTIKSVELPYNNYKILQDSSGNAITSDTEFLVYKVLENNTHNNADVLEIGSGNGVISIMLALHRQNWRLTGVEVQVPLYHLAIRNMNSTKVNIDFKLADIRNYSLFLKNKKFDIIVSNPPYYKVGTVRPSPNIVKNISRTEFLCSMDDIFSCINYNLQKKGLAFVLYPIDRTDEIIKKTLEYKLHLIETIGINQSTGNIKLEESIDTSNPKKMFVLRKEIL